MSDETTEERPEATAEDQGTLDETPLERAERERDEHLANFQRARADYQNLRRRTSEDIQTAVRRERFAVLEEVLTVLDYLDMALATPCESADAKNLLVGVQMTRDQLWSMLERAGVAPIDAEGSFDTARHQAVATVESADHAPGQVVEVVRRGFTLGDAVLRYAQVKVAAGSGTDETERPDTDTD